MYDQILFPTDGSQGASVVFDHVLDIAAEHGATVHVLNVADPALVFQPQKDLLDALEQEGEAFVRDAADRARKRGVETVTEVQKGEPYSTIVDYAASQDVDLVVMPTHGRRGLERFLLGSTTERVLRRSDVPVLTIRPDDDGTITYPYQTVLAPTDGSTCAQEAIETAADVTTATRATLHLLTVVDIASLGIDVRSDIQVAQLEEAADAILDDATAVAETAGVEPAAETVEYGPSIHEGILSYIEDHDVDLVVVGTHGRTGFDRYVLGSVTEYLVRTSPIPVLTVREPSSNA
ncbi:universal stress protein [Halopiger aswanensis]|uniref:Nucleotide-binding universal stress UspA family protein n=1 Tax=Halopiger aswanensis TaxID=148449 RepID=A0A3R7GTD1_9EURY|nr:universal stress protein [Halopiger aswanensis]RKD88970.1 nucleotide-binding universal stress UspA family protein [Halopiger aswanensis]